jgi:hypothetical protein
VLPLLVLFAILVGAWRLFRRLGSQIDLLEFEDEAMRYDPHESIRVAEDRVKNRLVAEANRMNQEGR